MKTKELDKVLVVDFGSQTTKLIIRRIREIGFECEVIAYDELSNCIQNVKPKALILSGGPASSFKIKSPKIDIRILKMGIPVFKSRLSFINAAASSFPLKPCSGAKMAFISIFIFDNESTKWVWVPSDLKITEVWFTTKAIFLF